MTATSPAAVPGPRVRRWLLVAVPGLTALGTAAHLLVRGVPEGVRRSVARPFLLDTELTLPAWFSSSLLLAIAAVAWWLSRAEPDHARRWRVLAAAFTIMSLDEAIILHEMFDQLLADALGTGGDEALWVFPAAVAVALVGGYVLPLWRSRPSGERRAWLAALLAYGGGAVAIEFVSRPYYAVPVDASVGYVFLVAFEEGLEMAGAALFLWALLTALTRHGTDAPLTVTSTP